MILCQNLSSRQITTYFNHHLFQYGNTSQSSPKQGYRDSHLGDENDII